MVSQTVAVFQLLSRGFRNIALANLDKRVLWESTVFKVKSNEKIIHFFFLNYVEILSFLDCITIFQYCSYSFYCPYFSLLLAPAHHIEPSNGSNQGRVSPFPSFITLYDSKIRWKVKNDRHIDKLENNINVEYLENNDWEFKPYKVKECKKLLLRNTSMAQSTFIIK